MEEEKVEVKGYYVTEVPVSFQKVIALGDKIVPIEELIADLANKVERAGLK
mgnify:CR=1 FL=1